MGAKFKSVDEYIGTFPEEVQSILTTLRQTIKQAAPQAEELISYNMPAFKQNGFLVSYAAWKKHIGMYPVPAGDQAFQKAIAHFTTEKSTAQFPLNEPMPLELIAQLVAFRLKENEQRVKAKK
ncbi:MAG: DUF1801 domain-containing protein [Imperialibacter sp.]|uniref:iron chaperone n=1 Tax=Imperialibacter sp. TaxID=2038411 RepID=UPI0032EC8960